MSQSQDIVHAFVPSEVSEVGNERFELIASERRSSQRHRLVLQLATLTTEAEQQLCLVLNIGSGGMKIRYFGDAPEGAPVAVTMRDEQTFYGHVSWRNGDLLGIQFEQQLATDADVYSARSNSARQRSPRLPVYFHAQLWCEGTLNPAKVVNLSPSGAAVILSGKSLPSRQVALKVPGLASFPAQVRWTDGDRVGLSFNSPLLFTQLQRLVALSCLSSRAAELAA